MIKTKIIEKEVKEYFCDYCDAPSSTGLRTFYQCLMCRKIVCSKCSYNDCDYSDHDYIYCLRCWHLGDGIREQIKEIEKEADKKVEELRNKWKDACLK